MTYDEKLLCILHAINEARKVYAPSSLINLYITSTNGLSDFDENEIWDILSKIEREEKILKIRSVPSIIATYAGYDFDAALSAQTYFSLEIFDNFDSWFANLFNHNKGKTEDPSKIPNYDDKTGILYIANKEIKLQKNSFKARVLAFLLKDEKSRKQLWSWDEILEKILGVTDDALMENRKKFYPACEGLQATIALKTGINDLLFFNETTVQINPKYI